VYKNPFHEIVDIEELRSLFEDFTELTGFVTALLDMDGRVLVATGWREICTRFHRQTPESARKCLESDTILADRLRQGGKYFIYQCKNGLVDVAVPIIIDGIQVGRLYSGQFLFAPPDMEFFKRQAVEHGFDEDAYLDAVRKVPVVSEEKVRQVMRFMCRMAEIIVRMGMTNKRIDDADLIVRKSPAVLFRWRPSAGWPIEFVSDNVIQFGYTPEELISGEVPFFSMIHAEDLDRVVSEVGKLTADIKERFQMEYRIVTKGGGVRWVGAHMVSKRNAKGKISHYQGIVLDITERKLAAETLRESEERFRSLVETSSDWIWEVDSSGVYTYASPKVKDILGYDPWEVTGRTPFDLMPPQEAERLKAFFADKVMSRESFYCLENVNLHKNGQIVILETNGVPIIGADGELSGYRGVDRDITERKRAETLLRSSLEEKEILLKEIHHRVKNNLQIVSTLLDLQSESIHDRAALDAFQESQDRIKAMALIHESLYKTSDMVSIDVGRYIEALSGHLLKSYLIVPERISLRADAGGVSMGIDKAIPCGLIINELISNALKHAFPGDLPGEIKVSFQRAKEGDITLRVEDNGVGLPAGLEIMKTGTLGLQLVTMLARQLHGVLTVGSEPGGTSFSMIFRGE
jgi:PAS domain S-box-containing protein